jgi:hypothetical protein
VNDDLLLGQLEEVADRLGITIRYETLTSEELSSPGGLCRVEGEYVLILDPQAPVREKVQVIIGALRGFSIDDIYVKPVIRDLLEGSKDRPGGKDQTS